MVRNEFESDTLATTVYSRDSFIGTLETRLSRRSNVSLTTAIEKPRDVSTNCDDTAETAADSTDQSNAFPQTSPIRWEPLPRPDKRTHSIRARPDKRVPTLVVPRASHSVLCSLRTLKFILYD